MLKTLRLHNYKSFLNARVSFEHRHLIVGRNNSGKSSLGSALRFLQALAAASLENAAIAVPGGIAELCHRKLQSNEVTLGCECELGRGGQRSTFDYEIRLFVDSPKERQSWGHTLKIISETLTLTGSDGEATTLLQNDGHRSTMLVEEPGGNAAGRKSVETVPSPPDGTMLSKIYEQPQRASIRRFQDFLYNWLYFSLSPLRMRQGPFDGRTGVGSSALQQGCQVTHEL